MPSAFKVMTWNLENLFLPGEEGGPEDQAVIDQKLAALAATILQLSPDVLAVQEVGSEAAFEALQVGLEGNYPHTQLSSIPDGRGIRVGFLSRLPIEEHEDFADFPGGAFANISGLDRRYHHFDRPPCRLLWAAEWPPVMRVLSASNA